ncbi:SDR family NAD(P)-dependent oxidoreductase [Pedobacter frigiditerrae]|uniref:SDR family NAD(P)-dependent oxidoreductase n=1 Tax=Pedobacter frigiditerrae TaxID=2530452 RepID=A0A4R0N5F1_9SPHI|nr:NAD(P)H-binding protein [Pedobacter frigiditerrae]TCC93484.1 SDR family NAD(P)-dependent oxidoreductase [Pedobacter frigiditerrae]
MENRTISILGCGWYGLAMAKALVVAGYHVNGSTTSTEKLETFSKFNIQPYLINFDGESVNYDETFFNCDVLIISIPPKRNAQADYPSKIKNIAIAAEKAKVKQVIFISSTGIFQNGNFILDEETIPEPNTTAGQVLSEAETALKGAQAFTTTIIRFAGLIGPERNLAKHFAGKTDIANGLAPINLIHLDDCIGITKTIIEQKAFGNIYHGVTPSHPSRKDFYTKACLTSGFEKPQFIDELLDWKQVESKNVARNLAYQFKIENWMEYVGSV